MVSSYCGIWVVAGYERHVALNWPCMKHMFAAVPNQVQFSCTYQWRIQKSL